MFDSRVMMCSPVNYCVKYEINPWMHTEDLVNNREAMIQWQKLHHAIIRLGGYVEYAQPIDNLPDIVFTANAGLVKNEKVVLSNFKHQERQSEIHHFRVRFRSFNYEIYELPRDLNFEGAGDALFAGDKLFAGYGFRSDKLAYTKIAHLLDISEVIFCELVDDNFYHLDTCFCPLDEEHALYYPEAFTYETINRMKEAINLIPVIEDDAKKFACNSIVFPKEKTVIMPVGTELTKDVVEKLGWNVHEVEMSEFIKAGGACKCLTLQLD